MHFISIMGKNEVPEGGIRSHNVSGKDILIIRQDGRYYAIDRRCSHVGADLLKGELKKNIITCPRHGSKFDIMTGKSISGPRIGFIKLKTKDIEIYETKIEGDRILVRLNST